MARRHLCAGHDVVVPQSVGRLAFVDRLEALAQETGAEFRHVLLTEDRDRVVGRFEARSAADDRTDHHRAAAQTSGGRQGLLELYDAVKAVAAVRPGVLVVRSVEGDVDGTYAACCSSARTP
jgi:predicted kinase